MCSRCGCVHDGSPEDVRPAVIEGVLEPALLLVLSRRASYGYELAAALEHERLVAQAVVPARVYETLARLEADGAAESEAESSPSGPDRRRYVITSQGRARLDRWAASLRLSAESLGALLKAYDGQPARTPSRTRRPRKR